MESKESILAAIKKNKPEANPLPLLPDFPYKDNLIEQFQESLTLNGGKSLVISDLKEVMAYLKENYSDTQMLVSLVEGVEGNYDISLAEDPHDLEPVEVAILEGVWGAAENAAIWLPEENLIHRVLPFIAQHLVVLLKKSRVMGNMHEVYHAIDVAASGYGVLIAGPSKTADIEQSLIIGAHGPRSMTVFLIEG
ncbi:MAG: LUD domain-containing protein [Cyclobacteriaceae bacterium]